MDLAHFMCLQSGNTPLHLATAADNTSVVRALLRQGASATRTNGVNATALMLAAGNGNIGVVTDLIRAGSRAAAVDASGRTAADYAARNGHSACADLVRAEMDMEQLPKKRVGLPFEH